MRILVTGGAGFIGTNLVERLLALGHEVCSLDRSAPRWAGRGERFVQADLCDAAAVRAAIVDFAPEQVVHLGARTDLDETRDLAGYAANTDGVRNLLAGLSATPSVERVLFVSTKLVCRTDYCPRNDLDYCPDTLYGQSKVLGEQIVRGAGDLPFAWCIVRPTSIWGPWCGAPYRGFFEAIARGRYVHLGSASEPKRFGYVGNAVYQLERLLAAPAEAIQGRVFYLADYELYTIRAWAELIARELGTGPLGTLPRGLCRVAALGGDVARRLGMRNPPLTSFRLRNMWADTSGCPLDSIREIAPELPCTLEQGVRETLAWLNGANGR